MFAFLDVLFDLVTVYVIEGTYWRSKYLIGGLRNVLKVRMVGGIGEFTDVLKSCVVMLLVGRVICCSECIEALNRGGGGIDVY